MPIYEYEPDAEGCDHCRSRFESLQKASDPPLKKCPQCGAPCHRVLSSFATIKSTASILSPKNLAEKGFTQYKRAGGGYYEKTAGGGPDVIRR